MKKIVLLFLVFLLLGCEKDDICDENTATTPLLVISFFNINRPAETISVSNVTVQAEGMPEPIIFNTNGNEVTKYYFNGSQLKIPLRINETKTKYALTLNSNQVAFKNTDFLEFNYTTKNSYVSRACGYKTIFTLNEIDGVLRTDANPADNLWITNFTLLTTTIENPNETHLKILL